MKQSLSLEILSIKFIASTALPMLACTNIKLGQNFMCDAHYTNTYLIHFDEQTNQL